MYKKVILTKDGYEPMKLHYEVGKGIENDDYEELLNNFSPNFDFSLVDKMIQDFSLDIVPSFKKSSLFTKEDLEDIVRPFKKHYNIKRGIRKNPVAFFKPMTRKRNPKHRKPRKKRTTQTSRKRVNNKKVNNKK
jgi:hypothetical protein